jgi:hypothetical protein
MARFTGAPARAYDCWIGTMLQPEISIMARPSQVRPLIGNLARRPLRAALRCTRMRGARASATKRCVHRTLRRLNPALLATLVAGGCSFQSSLTGYDGPERPDSEIAILDCDGLCRGIYNMDTGETYDVDSVDHFLFMEHVGVVYLEPGQYRITILYWGAKTPWAGNFTTSVSLPLEAGHRYLIEGEVDCDYWGPDDTTDIWITDETTDTIIAERRKLRHNCS